MSTYREIKPAAVLSDCIDAYWTIQTGALLQPVTWRIFPDGCIDIIVNTGSVTVHSEQRTLEPGRQYLAGTMTVTQEVTRVTHSHLTGIRFRPGGFALFYREDLEAVRDNLVDFHDPGLAGLLDGDEAVYARLDQYFLRKRSFTETRVVAMTEQMFRLKGMVTVDALAKAHHLTHRTLERMFKKHTGITAREMTKIVRFRFAMDRLKNNPSSESLLRIAFETGYYDHAHLTHDIKKYAGLNPSDLRAGS